MAITTVQVQGMTCEHCVAAVRGELSKLDGVSDVAIDLESGAVTIDSSGPLTDSDLRAAVDEAGYELI